MAQLLRDFVKVENDFTIIPNEILRNKEMKSSTKNILLTMFSLPPTWDFSIAGIATCVKEGYETVQKSLVELEKAGYITRTREHKEDGTFGAMIYTIHQFPVSEEMNTYKNNHSNQDVKNPKQVKTNIGKNQDREIPLQENQVQLSTDSKLNKDFELKTDNESSIDNRLRTKKAETLSKDNDEADTISLKKSLPTSAKKKTKPELMELEADMCRRFVNIGNQYDITDTALKNIVNSFARYSSKFTERTGKIHPILKDETLEKIFVTLATISDTEYSHFENVADYEPDSDGLSYLDKMVDEHFSSEHGGSTDWHISHFARPDYLEKMAQHIVEW